MSFFGKQKKTVSHYDKMTKTPISRLILTLSVPSIISMLITNIYNLVDTAFVGQLGTSASGAVGVVFGFMAILQAFGFMFGQGAGSILSRALGAQTVLAHQSTAWTTGHIQIIKPALPPGPLLYCKASSHLRTASPFCLATANIKRGMAKNLRQRLGSQSKR